MNKTTKNIVLVIVLLLIIGSIWYLESSKPKKSDAPVQDVVVTYSNTNLATTTNSTGIPQPSSKITIQDRTSIVQQKVSLYPKAKEITDPTGFINTQPFKLSDIAGKKVVLLDFWTYSCINCLRTIPYLNAWYQKYKDQGLEIVGIHTPEFDFEKDITNVQKAVEQLGIKYPVVLDSNQGTWNAYQNSYWPREYLIDIDGFVVHDKIGEGDYAGTEQAIQNALKERDQALGLKDTVPTTITTPQDVISMDETKVQSPETYFGAARNEYLANGNRGVTGIQTLSFPTTINSNELYLDGTWNFQSEFAESTSPTSKIEFKYNSKNVYMVGSSKIGTTIKVFQDGKLVNTQTIKDNKLYTLIQGTDYGEHTLEIDVEGAGLDAFTFTFG